MQRKRPTIDSPMHSIDKEQVRMLVTAVGYKQASTQTGIPEPTLRQWSHRYNWNRQSPSLNQAQTMSQLSRRPQHKPWLTPCVSTQLRPGSDSLPQREKWRSTRLK